MSEPVQELQSVDDDERATRDADPAYLSPDYVGTRLRAPRRPLLLLPQTLSELTGPAFGDDDVDRAATATSRCSTTASRWASASSSAGACSAATDGPCATR